MKIWDLDTPTLLVDQDIMMDNLKRMQSYANRQGVGLRPHTKTHKAPYVAALQREIGACGIAVAKVGEAEVMAENGLDHILIANEIVGRAKLERICRIAEKTDITFGVDTPCQVEEAEAVFAHADRPAQVAVEIEVGENRSGVIEEHDFIDLLNVIKRCQHVKFVGSLFP